MPGRTLRSAPTVIIALAILAGLFASASVYWLLGSITQDARVAATGTLMVLLLGTLAGGQGLIGVLLKLDIVSLGLPFLRRYQPAFAFPLFFVFCSFVWLALNAANIRKRLMFSAVSAFLLILLTFSYLYLWTAAAAWLGCFLVLWMIFRWNLDVGRVLQVAAITIGIFAIGLLPYRYLLTQRSSTLDELQTIISTHRPDLFRIPELIGVLLLIVLAVTIWRGRLRREEPEVILASSFSLLPMVLFNHQVLTGRSMQPFHFEIFIANYVVLIGLVIVATLVWPRRLRSALPLITAGCLLLGIIEVALVAGGFHRIDVTKDNMIPAARRLKELAVKQDGQTALVFSPHIEFNQMLPTYAPQGTLLGMGAVDFGSATNEERKEFLFSYLYYSGVNPDRLREILNGVPDQLQLSYYVKYVIFGHERVRPVFSLNFQPISQLEFENEFTRYAKFFDTFSGEQVAKHPLTYVVVRANDSFDWSHIDQWYERSPGERVGEYILHQLQVRQR